VSLRRTTNYLRSKLGDRSKNENTARNAKTEQFINAKVSGNALKQGCKTHSMLRQGISQVQRHPAVALNSSQAKKVAAEMADTQG